MTKPSDHPMHAALKTAEKYTDRSPTPAQISAGNYEKGKFRWHGETIAIENPKGSIRSGTDKNGAKWECRLPATYGYLLGTKAVDGDHVDCYIGDDHDSKKVWVIDQIDLASKKYDEPKCMLSFPSREAALMAYAKAFSDGKAKERIGSVTEMSIPEFREWANSSAAKKPLGNLKGYAAGGAVMPLIKSGSRQAISSNIKEMEAAGHPKAQSIAAALSTARRYARALGGRIGFAWGGAPGMPSIPGMHRMGAEHMPMTPHHSLMAGVPHMVDTGISSGMGRPRLAGGGWLREMDSPSEVAPLPAPHSASIPAPKGGSPVAGWLQDQLAQARNSEGNLWGNKPHDVLGPLRDTAELTGIPEAARSIGAAVQDPTLANLTNAGTRTALAAWRPGAALKTLGAGYGAALAQDLGLLGPASAAQKGGISLPGLMPEQQAEYNNLQRQITNDAFDTKLQKQQAVERIRELRGLSDEYVKNVNAGKQGTQNLAESQKQGEYARAVTGAEAARDQALARDRRFSDTNVGQLWDKTGGLAPVAAGALTGGLSRAATGSGNVLYNYGLPAALGTLAGFGAANVPLAYNALFTEPDNPQKRAYEAYARDLPADHPRKQEWADYASKLSSDNPVRTQAAKEFYDPEKIKERALMGGSEGLLGGLLGADVPRALGRATSAMGTSLGRLAGRGPAELPDLPGTSVGPVSDIPIGGVPASRPPIALQPLEVGAPRPTLLDKLRASPPIEEQRLLPAPEASANLSASSAPQSPVILRTESGTHHMPDGKFAPKALYENRGAAEARKSVPKGNGRDNGKTLANGKENAPSTDEEIAGTLNGKAVPKKPAKEPGGDFGFWKGGKALDIARRYAPGGRVVTGPIIGSTPGRADKLPVSVPSGAYIVPADCVSALGEGNSLAGMHALEKMFGKSTPQRAMAAGGQATPIMISDGEFCVSPEQVAKIGRGSLDAGHHALDQFVLKVRKDHIQQLASLPGPQR